MILAHPNISVKVILQRILLASSSDLAIIQRNLNSLQKGGYTCLHLIRRLPAYSLIYPLDSVARSEVWMAYISLSDWSLDPDWPSNHIAAKEPVRYDGCQVDRQGCTLLKRTGFALPYRSHRRWYVQRPGTSYYGQ